MAKNGILSSIMLDYLPKRRSIRLFPVGLIYRPIGGGGEMGDTGNTSPAWS